MSISVCVQGLIAQGLIQKGQAQQANQLYARHLAVLTPQMGMMAAASLASQRTIAAMRAQLTRKKLLAAMTIRTRQDILGHLASYPGSTPGGPIDPRAGPALLAGDERARYSNVEGRQRAIRGRAHAMMDQVLAGHSSNLFGQIRGKADLEDLTRELFKPGSTSNQSAKDMADAWRMASEMLRQRFNAAGGDIGKIQDWGLPQYHDPRLVRDVDFDQWRDFIKPRLDPSKMIDQVTGLPLTPAQLDQALADAFDEIRSDGWASRKPGAQGQGSLANRRADPRFFVFKDADSWMEYSDRFGAGNAFDAMMGHIDGMARDTAMLEVLGPNPNATVQWLKDTLEHSAALDRSAGSRAKDRAFAATKKIDRLFDEITGANSRPEKRKLALTFSAIRSWETAAKLGGAMLSAVSDTAFQFSTRKYNGLGAASMLRDYAKLMRPGAVEDQKLAVRLGLIAEEWAHRTAGQSRYLGEELTGEVSRRMAEGVLRASGLARWTQAGRWAFGMELLGHITDESVKRFDALDPAFRGMLERYGFDAGDWDKIRATPLEVDRGVPWIKPTNVQDQRLGDRMLEMIARETDFAVPVADLNTRALMNSVAPRGTWHGEAIKSAFLFKAFGISVMIMQAQRIMAMAGPQAARYAAGLAIGTTLMGGLVLALKDIAAGRDPRDMTTPEFWGQATLQGGGWAIMGDFLRSSTSRAGGGLAGTVAGPLVTDAQQLANIATSKNHAGAAFKFARNQLPGGSLWYARLAFDRLVADQIQEAVDPNYRQSWRRMRRWADEQGTQHWWAPGELSPERAPDMTNAIGSASLDTPGQAIAP